MLIGSASLNDTYLKRYKYRFLFDIIKIKTVFIQNKVIDVK